MARRDQPERRGHRLPIVRELTLLGCFGAGGGDIPRALLRPAALAGDSRIVGIDSRPQNVAVPAMPGRRLRHAAVELQVGDGRSLPYRIGRSMSPMPRVGAPPLRAPAATDLLGRWSAPAVVVNDLHRVVGWQAPAPRPPADGEPLHAPYLDLLWRRAYRPEEMVELLRLARSATGSRSPPCRSGSAIRQAPGVVREDRPVDAVVVGGGPAGAVTAAYSRGPATRCWSWNVHRRGTGVPGRVRVAGRGAGAARRRAGRRRHRARRPVDPGDAGRVAARDRVPADYGAEAGGPTAVGFDSVRPGPGPARPRGGRGRDRPARRGRPRVSFGDGGDGPARVSVAGDPAPIEARVVVGADGPKSIVSHGGGRVRDPALADRIGLTWHIADVGRRPADRGPDGRARRRRLLRDRAGARRAGEHRDRAGRAGVAAAPRGGRRGVDGRGAAASRSRHSPACGRRGERARRPTRSPARARSAAGCRAGPGSGWLVVGDAAGFLDPFTGEGLHRAWSPPASRAPAIRPARGSSANELLCYERAMRRRFASKDMVSRLVLSFLAQPPLFERAARRSRNGMTSVRRWAS